MKKLTELTPEEKRILAAEACGWMFKESRPNEGGNFAGWWYAPSGLRAENGYEDYCLPDYGNDLNAMAQAVEAMPYEEQEAWLDALSRIVDPMHGYRMRLTVEIANATAAQRLDAFLLATGRAE